MRRAARAAGDGSIAPHPLRVLLVADPGVPTERAEAVAEPLAEALSEGGRRTVDVAIETRLILLTPDHALDLATARDLNAQYSEAPITILLTEIPRHERGHPLIAEVFPDEQVGVVSCPTFGALATRRRLTRILAACIQRIELGFKDGSGNPEPHWSRWGYRESERSYALHAHTFFGGPRLVTGMVVANEPWRSLPRLSGVLAAAAAAGAFGIFYNSIWIMADYLPWPRLLAIAALAMVVMVAWLMASNRLWDRPERESLASVVFYYNVSTVITLLVCVLALFAALGALILGGSLVVIDVRYMADILGHPAGFMNYLRIAVLSASMGLIAGALGASFDSDADIRRLTHGQRERLRVQQEDAAKDEAAAAEGAEAAS
ncbi:hypothetical protein [Brevibacterium rongguiense]|uniref:hypothetical protein n=1 Tax=Brevibacterium rongguiense TaxID=2695267 RepID=UPI002E2D0859|nr:hypothetical protein [Brevibacterium rongguiense]